MVSVPTSRPPAWARKWRPGSPSQAWIISIRRRYGVSGCAHGASTAVQALRSSTNASIDGVSSGPNSLSSML